MPRLCSSGNSDSGMGDRKMEEGSASFRACGRNRPPDLAARREFYGVAGQVRQDLPQPGCVPRYTLRNAGTEDAIQIQAFGLRLFGQESSHTLDGANQVEFHAFEAHLAGFDLREVQNI